MNKVYEYKSSHSQVKDVDIKEGIVSGYFSHFGTQDSDGDVIQKGAFTKSINESGPASSKPRIKHLLNHNPGQPLGVITVLKEDETGLYYESKIGTHSLGKDFLKMVESGIISEHSIGFKTIAEKKQDDYNLITDIKLWEGSSLTAWGANMHTPIVAMKGTKGFDMVSEKVLLMEKFIKNSDASDEAIQLMQIQLKQLQQYIIDLQSTTEPQISTQPEKNEDMLLLIKKINSNFKK